MKIKQSLIAGATLGFLLLAARVKFNRSQRI